MNQILYTCEHFTWREALWLPRWGIEADPDAEQRWNIMDLAHRMEIVREILRVPIVITSWLRPFIPSRGDYNKLIGGAALSAHRVGKAADFIPITMTCDEALLRLAPYLEALGLRAEDNGESKGRAWIHLDTYPVPPGGNRIFQP